MMDKFDVECKRCGSLSTKVEVQYNSRIVVKCWQCGEEEKLKFADIFYEDLSGGEQ